MLNYHGLLSSALQSGEKSRFSVTEANFLDHLQRIAATGCSACSLKQICDGRKSNVLAITFDDGRASDYEVAFPLLIQAGFAGDFFINPTTIGHKGYLSWAQAKEMHRAGMSVQSHGHEHVDHSQLDAAELKRQLAESKRTIEDHLGSEVEFFAAPYGEWNRELVEAAQEAGYRAVCITAGQLANPAAKVIDRICIDAATSTADLAAILARDPGFFAARELKYRVKRFPKAMALKLFPEAVNAWRERHHE